MDEKRAFAEAIARRDHQRVATLVAGQRRLATARLEGGSTGLFLACFLGAHQIAGLLLDAGADPEAVNDDGLAVICAAAIGGDADVIHLLVGRGAAVNAPPKKPFPLAFAVGLERYEAAAVLLELGAHVDARTTERQNTALFIAPNGRLAELLISHGADVNATNDEGSTPLHFAALVGNAEVVRCLLKHGADRQVLDGMKFRPIDSAKAGASAGLAVIAATMPDVKALGEWSAVIDALGDPPDEPDTGLPTGGDRPRSG